MGGLPAIRAMRELQPPPPHIVAMCVYGADDTLRTRALAARWRPCVERSARAWPTWWPFCAPRSRALARSSTNISPTAAGLPDRHCAMRPELLRIGPCCPATTKA